jgi:TRAP-type C4-dicarboxylate transport system permease small subunit
VVFGLLLPFVTGALLPASHVFLGLSLGVIQSGELISGLLSSIFRMPVEIIVHVAQGILTGMLIGVVFGVGAWILDRINWSRSTVVADIGSWTVAIVLGTGAVLLALFGSPDTLARLG